MKKNIKKVMIIVVILVSILGIGLTVIHAKNNLTSSQNGIPEMMSQDGNRGMPPDIPNNNGSTPPEMPNDDNGEKEQSPDMSKNNKPMDNHFKGVNNKNTLTTGYIIVISCFSLLFSMCLLYLIMSSKNDKFYKIKDKLIIYILSNIVLSGLIIMGTSFTTNNYLLNNNPRKTIESEQKDKVRLDESNVVSDKDTNLDKQDSDVTINKGGTYTFTGKFTHSIIVDAEGEDVEIVLENVTIENSETAAIIGLNANKIIINLKDGSTNTLSDGGNSSYDGCIFSNAELVFTGSGKLIVNGNQNEGEGIATEAKDITFNGGTFVITSNDDGINAGGDGATITFNDGSFYIDASGDGIDSNKNAIINGGTIFVMGSDVGGDAGIDTDEGFVINGGTVIALGSDMVETPLDTSKQKFIAFSLNSSIAKDTIVTLMKDDKEIISFKASKSFKTLIISSENLTDGNYELYTDGTNSGNLFYGIYQNSKYTKGDKLTINGKTSFEVTKTINLYKENR